MLIRFGKPVYKPVWELGRPFGLCAMAEADGKVTATVFKTANEPVNLTLRHPNGNTENYVLKPGEEEAVFAVSNPERWTDESPALYSVTASCADREETCRFGFSSFDPCVRLKGLVYARNGLTREEYKTDLNIILRANVNFLRVSKPDDELLSLCDEMGVYVQAETGIIDVGMTKPATQDDPTFREEYMDAIARLVSVGRRHPCVVLWGLGFNSCWGENFRAMRDYAEAFGGGRPVNFDLAMTVDEAETPLPVWSVKNVMPEMDVGRHYDDFVVFHAGGTAEAPGYQTGDAHLDTPILHAVMTPVSVANRDEIKRDPSERDFWGCGLSAIWEKIQSNPRCAGGVVDGYFGDETGIVTDSLVEKPEYFHVKKAFSPVRCDYTPNGLRIFNRFHSTDLSRVEIFRDGQRLDAVSCPPGGSVCLNVPKGRYRFEKDGRTVDEYDFTEIPKEKTSAPNGIPARNGNRFDGNEVHFLVDGKTGHISAYVGDLAVILSGPELVAERCCLGKRRLLKLDIRDEGYVDALVRYENGVDCRFETRLYASGHIETRAKIEDCEIRSPRRVKAIVGLDPGGLDEYGVEFRLTGDVKKVRWTRRAEKSGYPESHIGRPVGEAMKCPETCETYANFTTEKALFGSYNLPIRGSNDFRSMKRNIYTYMLTDDGFSIAVDGSGTKSVRSEILPDENALVPSNDPRVRYSGLWYSANEPGTRFGTERMSREAGASAEIDFTGDGIAWYGSQDFIGGLADVYLDGEKVASEVSAYLEPEEILGAGRGYEKRFCRLYYAVRGLQNSPHTLRVVALGKREAASQDDFAYIDHFRIFGAYKETTALRILEKFNYARMVFGNMPGEEVRMKRGDELRARIRLTRGDENS